MTVADPLDLDWWRDDMRPHRGSCRVCASCRLCRDCTGCAHHLREGCLGSDTLKVSAREAAEALRRGEKRVRAGHTDYEVTDDE